MTYPTNSYEVKFVDEVLVQKDTIPLVQIYSKKHHIAEMQIKQDSNLHFCIPHLGHPTVFAYKNLILLRQYHEVDFQHLGDFLGRKSKPQA